MSEFYPISCDCIVKVEPAAYKIKCNLHKNSRDVKECYRHNLDFTEPAKTERQARNERDRIRNL